jgi:hypothetical protein
MKTSRETGEADKRIARAFTEWRVFHVRDDETDAVAFIQVPAGAE